MTKPTAAANAAGFPEDPLSHHIDEARYSVRFAADLCHTFLMACTALPEPERTGLLAIHRAIDPHLDIALDTLDVAYAKAISAEARRQTFQLASQFNKAFDSAPPRDSSSDAS